MREDYWQFTGNMPIKALDHNHNKNIHVSGVLTTVSDVISCKTTWSVDEYCLLGSSALSLQVPNREIHPWIEQVRHFRSLSSAFYAFA